MGFKKQLDKALIIDDQMFIVDDKMLPLKKEMEQLDNKSSLDEVDSHEDEKKLSTDQAIFEKIIKSQYLKEKKEEPKPLSNEEKDKLKNLFESHFNNSFSEEKKSIERARMLETKAKALINEAYKKEFKQAVDDYNEIKGSLNDFINKNKNDNSFMQTSKAGAISDGYLIDNLLNNKNGPNKNNYQGLVMPSMPSLSIIDNPATAGQQPFTISGDGFTISGTGFLNTNPPKDLENKKEELRSMKDLVKESGVRVAADQSINLIKKTLIKILSKTNSPNIEQLLNSDAGNALISILLSNALRYVPQLKEHKNAESLATEFSVSGLSTLGNYLIDEHVLKFIMDLSSTLDSVDDLSKLRLLNPENKQNIIEDEEIYEDLIGKQTKV